MSGGPLDEMAASFVKLHAERLADRLMSAPDNRPDGSGLDDGPYLPGRGPRKQPEPKSGGELAAIRARAWATRRARYGKAGHS